MIYNLDKYSLQLDLQIQKTAGDVCVHLKCICLTLKAAADSKSSSSSSFWMETRLFLNSIGIGILVVNKDSPHPCGSEIVIIITIIVIAIIMSATYATKHFHWTACESVNIWICIPTGKSWWWNYLRIIAGHHDNRHFHHHWRKGETILIELTSFRRKKRIVQFKQFVQF